MTRTIALVGLRASGKTSVGSALARELGLPFVDLDVEIVHEAHSGRAGDTSFRSAGDVLAALGEDSFREIEALALRRVLAGVEPLVLATGGGTVVGTDNRALLSSSAYVIWLEVQVPELQRRLRADSTHRPALVGQDAAEEVPSLSRARETAYAAAANWTIDATGSPPIDIARRIAAHLHSLGLVPRD